MVSIFKNVIASILASTTLFVSACSNEKNIPQHETGLDQAKTDEFDPDKIVFYELGKSSKSDDFAQPNNNGNNNSTYKACDSDSDCLIKNKHVINPLDPKNSGKRENETIPLENKAPSKPINDEIYNLIDELGNVEESLSEHRNKATFSRSVIEKKESQIKEAELNDAITKEIEEIEARRIMNVK
jgi:hypothetical protein